jgi:putative membrane protein
MSLSWLYRSNTIPFVKNWPLHIMIIVFILVWGLLAINPVDRIDWLLENALLIIFIAALAILYRTFALSNIAYLLITLFFILHAIGAHYTYQNTPVDVWIKKIFLTKRAIYDRIVHFSFGLFIAYPILETVVRVMKLRNVWSYAVTFAVILASSALFEIVEMLVALLAGPLGEEYLGLQGDPLDTQKDMAMTLIGSLLFIGLISWLSYLQHRDGLGLFGNEDTTLSHNNCSKRKANFETSRGKNRLE